jgi:hypothetical protein
MIDVIGSLFEIKTPPSGGWGYKNSKAPDGQGPLLTNYKPKL